MINFRKFKRFTRKTVSAIVLIFAVLLIVLFHKWVLLQMYHTAAFYHVWQADEEYKKGNFQKAISKYSYAVKLYPEHYKAHYNLGNIYVVYEDYNSAVICYNQAITANPNYLNARINLGIVLAQQILDIDRAIIEYKKAINSKPFILNIPFIFNNKPSVWHSKSIAYYNLGLAYKNKALLYKSGSPEARNYLKLAAQCYRNSLKIIPDSYESHYNLALTMQLLGVYTESLQEYCKSINLQPLDYEAHYNLAILLRQRFLYRESINELEKAGLLLDARGDYFKTAYIYQTLNEVSQRAIARRSTPQEFIADKLGESPAKSYDITYVRGKVVPTEDLDKAIMDNMKTCSVCKTVASSK